MPRADRKRPSNEPTEVESADIRQSAAAARLNVETDESASNAEDTEFFFDRIGAITDAEWESRYVGYLYQIAPKIALPGDRHYIAKLNSRFDEADILARHGSGQYHVKLNDKKLRKTIATHLFTVYDARKPPQCDPTLIVDCPENQPYLKWIQRSESGNPAPAAAPEAAKAIEELADAIKKPKPPTVTEELLLGMAQGRDELASKLAEAARQSNVDPIAALSKAVELVRSLQSQSDSGKSEISTFERALAMWAKLQPTNQGVDILQLIALVEKLNPPRPKSENEDDSISYIEKVLNVADRIRPPQETTAAGASVPESEWARIVAAMQPSITALITNFPQLVLGIKMAMKSDEPGISRPSAAAGPPATPTVAGPSAAADQPPTSGSTQAQPRPTQEQAMQQQVAALLQQIVPTLLFHVNNGLSGSDLAGHTMDSGYMFNGVPVPGQVVLQMARQMGKESLLAFFRSMPALWAQIVAIPEGEMRFGKFVEEFLSWVPSEAEDDDQEAA
jgi:hypothetical protein